MATVTKIGALDPRSYLALPVSPDVAAEVVSMEHVEATTKLMEAAQAVRLREVEGSVVYGHLVQAVVQAMEVGLTRAVIAGTISAHLEKRQRAVVMVTSTGRSSRVEPSKGLAARYVMLARWERGEWLPGETPLTEAVTINGQAFDTPVAALFAGVASFTYVWEMFKAAIRPVVQDLTKTPDDPVVAIEQAVARMGFRVKGRDEQGNERLTTVAVTTPVAFVAVMHGLLKLDVAQRMLPPKIVRSLVDTLEQAVTVIPPQAKTLTLLKGGRKAA